MPPSKASSPPSSIAVPIVAVAFVLAVAAAYFKFPAAAILWLGCLAASVVEPNVQPTGAKVKGVPTPIDDRQAKDIQTARYWRAARLRLLVPMDLFTPGKRIYASWVAALVTGVAMYAVPQIPSFFSTLPDKSGVVHFPNAAARDSMATLFHIANAFFAAWLVAALMATKRKVSQGSPGVHLSTLLTMMRHGDRRVLAGVFGGAIAGLLIATVLWMVVPGFSWLIQLAGVLGGALAGPALWWSEEDLRAWRRRLALEAEWSTIWENGKIEPAPLLEDVEDFGDAATVLTWRVMGAKSASDVISSLPKVVHSLGHDRSVYELYAPVMVQGEPQYGSVDPQRFRVALIDSQVDLNLDAAADVDPGMVRLVLECAMAIGCDTARLGRLGLTDCEIITTPTSSRAAWGTRWVGVGKEAPGLKGVRDSGAIRGTMTEKLGCDVLVDHRSDALFVGHLTGDGIEFQDEGMDVTMDNLDREDFWNIRWTEGGPTKWKANQPTLVPDQRRVAKLENGAEIIREVFLIRHGTENTDYFGVDVAMTTAMDSAAMFTVAGFADRRSQRAGDRVASGIAVYYAKNGAAIPASMDRIKPAVPQPSSPTAVNAQAWVITAMVNKAFSEARLARPEITKVTCLTKPTLSRHLWEINIRLHGAVTLSDVRKKTGKIASILNVPWMRVVGDNDGIVLYAGASPDMDVLARPERDYVRLLSFDWEEAFREAGVMNNGGEVPKLDDIIPSKTNDLIATLEFELPSGKITEDKIKGSIDKLRNMTRKDFIMLKESSKGASGFALVVADSDPMPKMAPFDPELARTMKGNPFASDIENNPVCLNLGVDSPHLLFAGTSGSGKDCSLDSLVAVADSRGWVRMGDLVEGDLALTPSGQSAPVIAFSPIEVKREYELHLSDGGVARASGTHLWKVRTPATSQAARRPEAIAKRERQSQVELGFANKARAAIEAVPVGTYATVEDMVKLSGLYQAQIRRVLHPDMSIPMFVPTNKRSMRYSSDDVRAYAAAHPRHSMSAKVLSEVPAGKQMTLREIADSVFGHITNRNERDQVRYLIRQAKPRGVEGYATRSVDSYDVRETMLLVAQWHEGRAGLAEATVLMTTAEMIEAGLFGANGAKFSIEVTSLGELAEADVPIDPYVLGAWLGDGSTDGGNMCGHNDDRDVICSAFVEADYPIEPMPSSDNGWVGYATGLRADLRAAGVLGRKHIPMLYKRASDAQRLALLQGLMDTDGTIDPNGSCELCLSDETLANDALELIRSLGIKASKTIGPAGYRNELGEYVVCKDRHRIHFTTERQVFRLARKAKRLPVSTRATQQWRHITDIVDTGRDVEMRCLVLGNTEHMYLTDDLIPTHNSKAAQAALASVLLGGDDLVIIDPQKGAADFLFLKDWTIGWADTLETSVATLQALYAEMQRRIKFYRDHGKADVRDLPEDIRPKRIIVFIDEFIGLITSESVPFNKKSTDPEIVEAREKAEAENAMRETSAGRVGKLLGEARSAGIHLVLASQSLKADSLNKVPGGSTMKNNLGRTLLGNASTGDKASALRRPYDAQVMKGEVPKGRGLWEPVSLTSAIIIQVWYADQDVYLDYLEKYVPKPSEDRILDIDKFMPKEQAEGDDIIGPIPESLRAALGLSASGGFIDGEVVAATNVVSEEVIDDFTFDIPETDGELVEVPFDIPVDGGADISQSELDEIDEAALLAQLSSDDVYDVPGDETGYDAEPVVSLAKTDAEPEDVYDVPGEEAEPEPEGVSTVSSAKDELEPYDVPDDDTEPVVSLAKTDVEPKDVYDVPGDESEPDDKPVGYFVPKKVVADEW